MFDVSDEAKQVTTECKHGFSCLEGNRECLCDVENCAGTEVLFVKYLNKGHCIYEQSFGYSCMCTCPVRKELYKKHKV